MKARSCANAVIVTDQLSNPVSGSPFISQKKVYSYVQHITPTKKDYLESGNVYTKNGNGYLFSYVDSSQPIKPTIKTNISRIIPIIVETSNG